MKGYEMDYKALTIEEIIEIEKITEQRMNCSAEHWLDIAYKLDYISLEEKENVVSVIKKWQFSKEYNVEVDFSEKNYLDVKEMREIIFNTIIPEKLVRAAQS